MIGLSVQQMGAVLGQDWHDSLPTTPPTRYKRPTDMTRRAD